MKPYWQGGVPDEVRGALEPILERWSGFLPTWCQEFRVDWAPGEEDLATVTIHWSNRWAVLKVTPAWLSEDGRTREIAVVHELLHVFLEPLVMAGEHVFQSLPEEGGLVKLAAKVLKDGREGAVEDLAQALWRLRYDGD
jgi:hypothetical protein